MRRDLGDFQTPPSLVAAVLDVLGPIGARWPRVLEPTCGSGRFLAAVLDGESPPREARGIEIQEGRRADALAATAGRAEITRASLFDLDLKRDLAWRESGPMLVVGNPPWVTNAELGKLASANLPVKRNVNKLRGIDARTGASNFDVAEAVWLKLIAELAGEEATIALLCKTSVARRVLEFARREALAVAEAAVYKIDAAKWFGASVDACLLRVAIGTAGSCDRIPVFSRLSATEPESTMGLVRGRLVADLDAYERSAFADGVCPFVWRQGLKHDAAGVMELTVDEHGSLRNKQGESVDVESAYVYPLLKGTDLHRSSPTQPRRAVLAPQTRIGEDTRRLEGVAPRLWNYLQRNAASFDKRKSSIYRNQPPFALFGVGPYSFEPYKVAVSGLHPRPRFRAVGPIGGKPVMLDDTCYALPCPSAEHAALASALLNAPTSLDLIRSLTFPGAKRPITKAVLQRIDLGAMLARADRDLTRERARTIYERDFADESADAARRLDGPPFAGDLERVLLRDHRG